VGHAGWGEDGHLVAVRATKNDELSGAENYKPEKEYPNNVIFDGKRQ
jgi:hypothetical protein